MQSTKTHQLNCLNTRTIEEEFIQTIKINFRERTTLISGNLKIAEQPSIEKDIRYTCTYKQTDKKK